jgi:aspartyl-tRNA(Asn)/glutamyl-tRNA(Gln) amidotransferase subunit A
VDCLALPAMAITPPAVGQDEVVLGDGSRDDASSAMLRFTCMFNHTGHPAVSVPAAAGDSGTGVQFVGRHFAEGPLLAIASGYERSLGG